jgi:hypothetical protein
MLTTLYLTSAKNTDSWCARKGNLQCAFPLDVSMVHSFALIVSADGERMTCGVFSLSETVSMRNDSSAAFMGSTHSGPPSPLWAMIEDSTEEFYTAFKQREGLLPPLFQEAWYGDSICPRHNNTMAGGHSGHLGHDDGSTACVGTAAGHRPPF